MKVIGILIFCIWISLGMKNCVQEKVWTVENLTTYDHFAEMEHIFHQGGDTTYVINFWATWCGPCVKELPYFEELPGKDKSENIIKVILVSLDFKNQLESKLLPFLNEHRVISEVIFLKDAKYNDWIDKVDPAWSGSIPITVIYNKNGRVFLERDFNNVEEIIAQIP